MASVKVIRRFHRFGFLKLDLVAKSLFQPRTARFCSKGDEDNTPFDPRMLDVLACPLSKKPLRYDAANNELVCDELGVAYPIVRGIPNLNPHDGRMIKKTTDDNPS